MRTAIFVGLLYVGDSISLGGLKYENQTQVIGLLATLFLFFIVFDIVEFINKNLKTRS